MWQAGDRLALLFCYSAVSLTTAGGQRNSRTVPEQRCRSPPEAEDQGQVRCSLETE